MDKRNRCPLCHDGNRSRIRSFGGPTESQLFRCQKCGFIYANRVSNDHIKQSDYFAVKGSDISQWEEYKRNEKDQIYKYALSLFSLSDTIISNALDVGSASGHFLDLISISFRLRRETCLGVDLDYTMLSYLRKKGYKTWAGHLHTIPDDYGTYDIITFMETLEHVEYPKEDLSKAYEMLSFGGGATY